MNTWERPRGVYPFSMAMLDLLLSGFPPQDSPASNDILACVILVMREMFAGSHSWRYRHSSNRDQIGMFNGCDQIGMFSGCGQIGMFGGCGQIGMFSGCVIIPTSYEITPLPSGHKLLQLCHKILSQPPAKTSKG